jgi:hypothetical protein
MSPTAFQHQITELVAHLLRCREHCDTILTNRRISREHGNLDNLRAGLKTCSNSIWFEFNALRNILGSRIDLGDETARHAVSRNTRDLEASVEYKLRDIAARRNNGPPGFKDILRTVERIEEKVKTAMIDLGSRFGAGTPSSTALLSTAMVRVRTAPKLKSAMKSSNRVSLTEVDNLRDHLKDSWEETRVGSSILYVNCYDRSKTQWTRPHGYIKPLPKPAVVPVWQPQVTTMALTRRDPMIQYRIV